MHVFSDYVDAINAKWDISTWHDPFALTLTLRQKAKNAQFKGAGAPTSPLIDYSRNFRHFMNVLNTSVYQNRFRRGQTRLRVFAVAEHHLAGRLHYHAAVERPQHVERDDFEERIAKAWRKTHWGHEHMQITPNADKGWQHYLLKTKSKGYLPDHIDWANCHL